MERDILEASIKFRETIGSVLDALDEEQFRDRASRMRPGGRANILTWSDNIWLEQFRFTQSEAQKLVKILDLPEEIKCPVSRNKEDSLTALCMLLRRLAYPTRLLDVEMQFGWESSRFSRISRLTAEYIYDRWKHLLRFNPHRLTPTKLAQFGVALAAKGCPMDVVTSLIDGTLQKNARPVRNQRLVYNGWKRIHCLKYHVVISPDGMVIHIYGPVEGRRHDETVYKQSGLASVLEKHFWHPDGHALFVYGDPAYSVSSHVLAPYKGIHLTEGEKKFNTAMSKVREPVEWLFKEATQQFAYLNFAQNNRLLLQPVGLYYLTAIIFCNCHTILHHPQIPQYFNCLPPTLEEYFMGERIDDEELERWCMDTPWTEQTVQNEEDNESDLD